MSSKKSERILSQIIEWTSDGGMTVQSICKAVGINKSTYYDWLAKDKDFKKAIEDAQEEKYQSRLAMAQRTQAKLLEGYEYEEVDIEYESDEKTIKKKTVKKRYVGPNPTIVIFTLKNLDERYNMPDHVDVTSGNEKITQQPASTVFVLNIKGKSKLLEEYEQSAN